MKKQKYLVDVALVMALPVLGAILMYVLIFAFPMSEKSTSSHIIYTIILIALGLIIPYGMLKFFAAAAHEWDPREKELHLEDIPKDKEQLDKQD